MRRLSLFAFGLSPLFRSTRGWSGAVVADSARGVRGRGLIAGGAGSAMGFTLQIPGKPQNPPRTGICGGWLFLRRRLSRHRALSAAHATESCLSWTCWAYRSCG